MDQSTCRLLVEQMIDDLCAENVEAFVQLFIPNAELILPNAYCIGKDAIRNAVVGMVQTYENISIQVSRILAKDDVALVEWRWCDCNRLTGEAHATDTALVLEFEGSQIKRWREYHSPVLG